MTENLLEMRDVFVSYSRRGRAPLNILKGASLSIGRGETLGLVGESGAGKSTIAYAILGLAPIVGGSIAFDGKSIVGLSRKEQRALTSEIQIVFQDPLGALNPTRTIGSAVAEPLVAHGARDREEIRERVSLALAQVGMDPEVAGRTPGQFSGGQLQRIVIARSLMLKPKLIILDEPVSALDLSVQAQVLNLLADLQVQTGVSYLFVSHDLTVVEHIAHRVAVIQAGEIVEEGTTSEVISAPQHTYTKTLLNAVLLPDPAAQRAKRLSRAERTT